jgi:tetratricopeptide (TPR) repeat protein
MGLSRRRNSFSERDTVRAWTLLQGVRLSPRRGFRVELAAFLEGSAAVVATSHQPLNGRPRVKNTLLRAAIVVTCASVVSPALAQNKPELGDTIVTKSDKKKCEIIRLDAKNVVYKDSTGAKAKELTIAWSEVKSLEFKDFPSDLGGAEAAMERRDYAKAEGSAEDAIKSCGEGRAKDLFLARAQCVKAHALRGQARYQDAAQIADAALASANGGRYARDAYIEKVGSLADGGIADCVKAGDDAESKADDFGDEFRYDIYLQVGTYYLHQKDADNALKKFGRITSERRDIQDRADLGKAYCKVLQNDPDGASDAFRRILASATDTSAIAGASVGLGETVRPSPTRRASARRPRSASRSPPRPTRRTRKRRTRARSSISTTRAGSTRSSRRPIPTRRTSRRSTRRSRSSARTPRRSRPRSPRAAKRPSRNAHR